MNNDFCEERGDSAIKSLPSRLTSWKKIALHGNPYIIVFLTNCLFPWHANLPSEETPLILVTYSLVHTKSSLKLLLTYCKLSRRWNFGLGVLNQPTDEILISMYWGSYVYLHYHIDLLSGGCIARHRSEDELVNRNRSYPTSREHSLFIGCSVICTCALHNNIHNPFNQSGVKVSKKVDKSDYFSHLHFRMNKTNVFLSVYNIKCKLFTICIIK